jgi:predicted ATPase/DNA-binding SARP family transcriptional activator
MRETASTPLPGGTRAGIAVLGPMAVVGADGTPVSVRSRRQGLLLAVLVIKLGRVAAADELVDALWGDELPDHPTAALQSQVFRLRRQLAPAGCAVETDAVGYRLRCPPEHVDAARFEARLAQARREAPDPAVAAATLDQALGLWRGWAYLEVADHEAVRAEAARLEELRAEAEETRAHLLLALGRTAEAARAMERLRGEHPFRERPVAIQMRALAREGRHVEALRAFDGFRRTLAEELGLDPSAELRALEDEVLRGSAPSTPRIGLPGNTLVGRDQALAEVHDRLAASRLVTLTGPGGVGKTRLALHAAARAADRYPDGVWLCELASVGSDGEVAPAVASVLQVERDPRRSDVERVVHFLRPRRAVLLVDNCEHVLEGVRALTASMLAHAPDVDIIATSRRRLGLEGEYVVPVGPLAVPSGADPDSPAVELFVDRASAVRPGFVLTRENTAAVCELCRRLGGIPLAVELAAARTVSRTPQEILADLADRSERLADPGRMRERHRSIESVLAWSYERLTRVERHVFRTTAVFAGGFTADAAAAVAEMRVAAAVDTLTALVEHSLVAAHDDGGTTRFSLLEPVRQYAEARLDEMSMLESARFRHAAWAADWIDAADAGLRSAVETRSARAVSRELANLRAAHAWSLDHDLDAAARIAGGLYWYAFWYGATEVFRWAAAVVARAADAATPGVAAAYAPAVLAAARAGDIEEARSLAARGIDHVPVEAPASARFVWEAVSSAEVMAGNYERALDCQQQALDLARAVGDTAQEAREHGARALVSGYLGRPDDALTELAFARTLAGRSGCPTASAFCDYVEGEMRMDGLPAEALPLLERAWNTARTIGNRYLAAIAGVSALSCAARLRDPAPALGGFAELLEYFDRAGSRAQQWTTIRTLIETLARLGRVEPAAILYGALCASPNALPLIGGDAVRIQEAVATLERRLGPDRLEQLSARGAALDDDEAMAYAVRCTR